MKLLPLEAARMQDETGNQFLRLDGGAGNVWYAPTDNSFEIVSDAQADALEHFYQQLLDKEVSG